MAKRLYTKAHALRVVDVKSSSDHEEPYRTSWRRDYARLIHSAAFRRLQGKTQLFPGGESDFFRNRLTHSLEVAQIAKSIAIRINNTIPYFKADPIDTDLVETAALAHDLGHPPFGHNGEKALNELMRDAGGFEGNAQTLRILAKLEKRQTISERAPNVPEPVAAGKDNRTGLNLTYRTLAAVLKYDQQIPPTLNGADVRKGYYYTESDLVVKIKKNISTRKGQKLRTVECAIMDIADDIAYSTYDLEDSFKAQFLTPASMFAVDERLVRSVAETISSRLKNTYVGIKEYAELPTDELDFDVRRVYQNLTQLFSGVYQDAGEVLNEIVSEELDFPATSDMAAAAATVISSYAVQASQRMTQNGYFRSKLTSDLVGKFIRGVRVEFDEEYPALTKVYLDIDVFKQVEVLKNFAYQALIMSPMLKVAEYRGKDIVKSIFNAVTADDGYLLMPSDFQELYQSMDDPALRKRVICDFIAGMTDRYAIQFYSRLFGANPETIYSPL